MNAQRPHYLAGRLPPCNGVGRGLSQIDGFADMLNRVI